MRQEIRIAAPVCPLARNDRTKIGTLSLRGGGDTAPYGREGKSMQFSCALAGPAA